MSTYPSRKSADNHLPMDKGEQSMAMPNWWFSYSACRWSSTLGGLLHSSSGYDFSLLASWLLQRTYRFPTSSITSSFSFHSTHYIALCSVDRIARSANFLSLPPFLHVPEHIEFTLNRATSMYATGLSRCRGTWVCEIRVSDFLCFIGK